MTDQSFLWWIHERLVHKHKESEMVDYMHHLRAIIADTPPEKQTATTARIDSAVDKLREKFKT